MGYRTRPDAAELHARGYNYDCAWGGFYKSGHMRGVGDDWTSEIPPILAALAIELLQIGVTLCWCGVLRIFVASSDLMHDVAVKDGKVSVRTHNGRDSTTTSFDLANPKLTEQLWGYLGQHHIHFARLHAQSRGI